MTTSKESLSIGIDFGTSKCCVGVVRNGKVEIIENERGVKTTPSYVAFTNTDRLIGDSAKDQVTLNPGNTIYSFKRFMGYTQNTDKLLDTLLTPSCVTISNQKKLDFNVKFRGEKNKFIPEQVTSMLLAKMKRLVEDKYNCVARAAVISVPVAFNSFQRQSTMDAGSAAGFEEVNLIDESTATALAFANNLTDNRSIRTVFVLDFGDEYLSVGVASVQKNSIKMKGICGIALSGDSNVNKALMEHCIAKAKADFKVKDINVKAIERIKAACVNAKHTLSLLKEAIVHIDNLITEDDFHFKVNREMYSDVLEEVKTKLTCLTGEVLKRASINKNEIDEVLLIGGSARIPRFQDIVKEIFGEIKISKTLNVNEAVAEGAAIQAALISKEYSLPDIKLEKVAHNTFTCKFTKGANQQVSNFVKDEESSTKFYFTSDKMASISADIIESNYIGSRWTIGNILDNKKITVANYSAIEIEFSLDGNGLLQCIGKGTNKFKTKKNGFMSDIGVNFVPKYGVHAISKLIEIEKGISEYCNRLNHKIGLSMELETMCLDYLAEFEGKDNKLTDKANKLLDLLDLKESFNDKALINHIKTLQLLHKEVESKTLPSENAKAEIQNAVSFNTGEDSNEKPNLQFRKNPSDSTKGDRSVRNTVINSLTKRVNEQDIYDPNEDISSPRRPKQNRNQIQNSNHHGTDPQKKSFKQDDDHKLIDEKIKYIFKLGDDILHRTEYSQKDKNIVEEMHKLCVNYYNP